MDVSSLNVRDRITEEMYESDVANYAAMIAGTMPKPWEEAARVQKEKEDKKIENSRKSVYEKRKEKRTSAKEKEEKAPIRKRKPATTAKSTATSTVGADGTVVSIGDVIEYKSKEAPGKKFKATVVEINKYGKPRIRRKSTGRVGAVNTEFVKIK